MHAVLGAFALSCVAVAAHAQSTAEDPEKFPLRRTLAVSPARPAIAAAARAATQSPPGTIPFLLPPGTGAGTTGFISSGPKSKRARAAKKSSAKQTVAAAPAAIADMPKAGDDRRSKFEPTPLVALAKAAVARRLKKIALTAASIVGAVLIAGIMIDSYLEAAPQREAKRKAAELLDQIQAASQGTPIGTHVYGGAIYIERTGERAAVVVEGLSPDQCAHAGWMLAKTGGVSVGGYAPGNASLNAFRALCTAAPGGATLTWIPRLGSGAKK